MANKNAIPPDGGFRDHPERINRNGAPKKLPNLDKLLIEVLGDEDMELSEMKLILIALAKDAKGGNTRAAEILLDRAYHKVKQPIDITSQGEKLQAPTIIVNGNTTD
jgi:hypothetical protein